MKDYLKFAISRFLNTLVYLKAKLNHMIFKLLDAVQEQFGRWYFIEFILTNKHDSDDKYWLPIIACMRDKIGALSLQNQIVKDLSNIFFVSTPEISEFPKSQKELQIERIEGKFKNWRSAFIKVEVLKAFKKDVINQAAQLFTQEDLSIDNLDVGIKYSIDTTFKFKVGIISNQGTPLHQIDNFPTIKINKGRLDPIYALQERKTLNLINNMKHNLDDINIGDEVYFESTNIQSNHDLYWKVIEKIKDTTLIIVQLNEMGHHDLRHTIDVKEVIYHNKLPL